MVPTTSGALDDLRAETAHVRQMSSRWLPTKCDLARVCMQLMLHRHCDRTRRCDHQPNCDNRSTDTRKPDAWSLGHKLILPCTSIVRKPQSKTYAASPQPAVAVRRGLTPKRKANSHAGKTRGKPSFLRVRRRDILDCCSSWGAAPRPCPRPHLCDHCTRVFRSGREEVPCLQKHGTVSPSGLYHHGIFRQHVLELLAHVVRERLVLVTIVPRGEDGVQVPLAMQAGREKGPLL